MTPKDDDIPDLFSETSPVPSARHVERAPSPGAPAPRTSVAPPAPVARPSVPPNALPSTGLSLDLATDDPPVHGVESDDVDEDEFDLLAATSARDHDLGLAPPAQRAAAPVVTRASSPELLAVTSPKRSSYPPPMSPAVPKSAAPMSPMPMSPAVPKSAAPMSPAVSKSAAAPRAALPASSIDLAPGTIEDLPLAPRVATRASSPELLAVTSPKRSSYPPPMSAAAPPVSVPPPGSLPSGLEGGNVLDWDLDEALGLAPTADLIVATTVPTKTEDDGPWPEARTPDPSEHAIGFEEAQKLAAFGPPPSGVLSTPLYFIRVLAGKDRVRALVRDAEQRLSIVETKRDTRVAELGESLRASLEGQERFGELYSQIARYDDLIQARERDLGAVDQQGANYFAEHERKLDEAKKATASAAAAVVERKLIADEAARAVSRARALVSRFEIEKRNV